MTMANVGVGKHCAMSSEGEETVGTARTLDANLGSISTKYHSSFRAFNVRDPNRSYMVTYSSPLPMYANCVYEHT